MRTDVYLIETPMPGDLPPCREYYPSCGFIAKNQTATLVGYTEGRYGSEDFILSALIDMASKGQSGMTWHPVEEPAP